MLGSYIFYVLQMTYLRLSFFLMTDLDQHCWYNGRSEADIDTGQLDSEVYVGAVEVGVR